MRWYFLFFLISGFCSLVYEIVWLRLAMAQFGVTTPLVSIVLSIYMAGLGLGCAGAGRLLRYFERARAVTPLRLYALAELLIGVAGLAVRPELAIGHNLLQKIAAATELGSLGHYAGAGLWISLTLLPWCACMGATFPLAMAAIQKSFPDESEQSFSYLYLANVLGAVLGTLIPAFVLIELLGFRKTLYVAAGFNALLAASALALSFSLAPSRSAATESPAPQPGKGEPAQPRPATLLWLLFLTGLISLGMEIVWIRLFTPYLGNLVYAFATILALYLLATFLGSQRYRSLVRRRAFPQGNWVWVITGLLALLPLIGADPRLPQLKGLGGGALRVAVSVFPFSAAIGFLTPMLVDRYSGGEPGRAGKAYAVNILGCILGPLVAGFLLLPWMGELGSLASLTLPLLVVGGVAALRRDSSAERVLVLGSAKALYAVVVLLSLLLAWAAQTYEERFPKRLVRRDHTATVIAIGEGRERRLLVNGIGMTALTPITKMMAHLPLAFLPAPPRRGLVIAFGMGTSFRSLLSWGIPTTAVELVPSVPAVFGYYHPDGPALLHSPLAQMVIDDGRRYLERSAELYDVIIVDPPPPVRAAGSSLLYSREFYAIVKKRLTPGGILQQWLPGGDPKTRASVARALKESFPYVRVFPSFQGWGYHFLASLQPLAAASASDLAARTPPGAQNDLTEWGPFPTAEQQFEAVLGREISLDSVIALAPGAPALEDDRPLNEYFLLRRFRAFLATMRP
ncbi:MAG: spermidine synthase [Candidatus Acidiferrales bacterium]